MKKGNGAGDRNRTYDLRVTSALLYRLSYTGGDAAVTLSPPVSWCNSIAAYADINSASVPGWHAGCSIQIKAAKFNRSAICSCLLPQEVQT